MNRKQKIALIRILVTVALLGSTALFSPGNGMRFFLYIMMYLIIGGPVLMKAGRSILRGRVFTEAFLMSVATLGAFLLAVLTKSGDYFEAIAVMLFYQVGELFESWAVNKSRRNIASLMDIRPDSAHLETEEGLCTLHPEKIPVGSIIQVQPGEKIPLDGVVTEGNSSLNTAALTGESLPVDVQPGSAVQSGVINLSGLLRIRTTQPFETSTASRVLALVENASSRKARSEHFIARFARVYTPLVCWLALALAVLPPLLMLLIQGHADFLPWLYRGLTFLVVSCPCALVISVPLTFFAGIGGASRCGVLVKGANYLEAMSKAKTVAFDKTGTLTQGVFKVQAVHPVEISVEDLLKFAAHAECASSHPIARSLQMAFGKEIHREKVQDIREESGYGVFATVDEKKVAVGNRRLMEKMGLQSDVSRETGTVCHVAVDGRYAGYIVIADEIKPTSKAAIEQLHRLDVENTVLLTGDRPENAQAVAHALGIDRMEAGLLPEDKVKQMEKLLMDKKNGETVLFVGDGINDAPVLTRADVGIAMGALGSDAAMEAADVVLMQDDPQQIPVAIRIARRTMGIVKQNIWFSLLVKGACLLLSALGITNMALAIFADLGVMVLAVINATRAMKIKE